MDDPYSLNNDIAQFLFKKNHSCRGFKPKEIDWIDKNQMPIRWIDLQFKPKKKKIPIDLSIALYSEEVDLNKTVR